MTWLNLSKKIWLWFAIPLLVGLIIFVRIRSNQPEYSSFQVESRDIDEVIELSGKLDAATKANLRFAAGGLITYLGAREGDQVKKWQTLASVDTRQLAKVLEQKLNLYAIKRGEFDQVQDDYKIRRETGDVDAALRRILEKNQYQLDNAVKDVEYQDLSLKLSRIYSPINGILVHSPLVTAGSMVAATDTWIVVDPTSLEFVANLDETELNKVKVGQQVELTLDAYPEEIISSTVGSISYAPKETTTGTTYEVKVKIPQDKTSLFRLGLNGTASIITRTVKNSNVLPSNAITYSNKGTTVILKEGGKYVPKSVVTGIDNNGYVEIVEGLSQGTTVYVQKN